MNIPVNPIGVPPEEPKDNYTIIKPEISSEAIRPNTPDNANKILSPKQKMQIKIRKVKEKQPRQPFLISAIAVLLALFFILGNITANVAAPDSDNYQNDGVQLTFLGDIMPGRYIQSKGKKNGYEYFYENVKEVWANSDYVFANLESSLLTSKTAKYKEMDHNIILSTDTEAVASMLDAGINAISFANNHSCDYGKKSFNGAIRWFEKKKVAYAGYIDKEAYSASNNETEEEQTSETYKPYTQLVANNKKIGFIAVTDKIYSKNISYGLLTTKDPDLYKYINQSALENDMTVVYVHWGNEYKKDFDDNQQALAHQFIDAGADIIIGSHPHVLQPVETYKKGIIFYSIGNFIMDQNNTFSCDSVIVQYNENVNGERYIELIPARIKNGAPCVTTNSLYKFRIKKALTSELDSSEYKVKESGSIIINY